MQHDEGVTPNDNDSIQPMPDYANRGQNFPVLTSAAGGHFSGTVSGTLFTVPGNYQIDIYDSYGCDDSGYGEGFPVAYGGHATGVVTAGGLIAQGQSEASFTLPIVFPIPYFAVPISITATATDANGNTSEFSACIPYNDDTIFYANFEPPLF